MRGHFLRNLCVYDDASNCPSHGVLVLMVPAQWLPLLCLTMITLRSKSNIFAT
jgi:hypothetical protein